MPAAQKAEQLDGDKTLTTYPSNEKQRFLPTVFAHNTTAQCKGFGGFLCLEFDHVGLKMET